MDAVLKLLENLSLVVFGWNGRWVCTTRQMFRTNAPLGVKIPDCMQEFMGDTLEEAVLKACLGQPGVQNTDLAEASADEWLETAKRNHTDTYARTKHLRELRDLVASKVTTA